jgi:hypothetical protein
MYVATLDTPHFAFLAVGATPAAALEGLRQGWRRHRRATGAGPWADWHDSARVVGPIEPGQCARDGEVMP